jgi:hypothetical protein
MRGKAGSCRQLTLVRLKPEGRVLKNRDGSKPGRALGEIPTGPSAFVFPQGPCLHGKLEGTSENHQGDQGQPKSSQGDPSSLLKLNGNYRRGILADPKVAVQRVHTLRTLRRVSAGWGGAGGDARERLCFHDRGLLLDYSALVTCQAPRLYCPVLRLQQLRRDCACWNAVS